MIVFLTFITNPNAESGFKKNYSFDNNLLKEQKQDLIMFEMANNGVLPSYKLNGDTLFIVNPMQGNSMLISHYIALKKAGLLLLTDNLGRSWYFKQYREKPVFQFEPIWQE